MTEIMQPIPARLKNVAVGGHVAGADQIIDDEQNKTQETINSEVNTALGNKANKSEMSVTPGTGANVDKTTIQLKSGTSATVLTQHQDISGKQDTINDLATIRSGAAAGATAQQPATTLSGYGITDAYTKSETYTKTEVNGLVDTPHQEYVTVNAYSALPATGSKDTIYRVSNYNGSTSQVDASVYSEYAWNGSQYIFLCVKSQIGEVFDISVYNNNAKYTDLAAALNGGANIPQSLRKGGMSVKFVQSSDNKYVQYRLMADEWSTTESDWQSMNVDEVPVAGSSNLVQSGGVGSILFGDIVLVQGGIDLSGNETQSAQRLKSNFFDRPVSIEVNTGYQIYLVAQYDRDTHTFVAASLVNDTTYQYSGDNSVRLVFANINSSANITPDENVVKKVSSGFSQEIESLHEDDKKLSSKTNPVFESGTLSQGTPTDNATRIRTIDFINADTIFDISVDANHAITIVSFDKDLLYIGQDSNFVQHVRNRIVNGYFKIIIKRTDNGSISPSEDCGLVCRYSQFSESPASDKWKLIKLESIDVDNPTFEIGKYYYRPTPKTIVYKIGTNNIIIPFLDGAIYTYNNKLYKWDGNNLILADDIAWITDKCYYHINNVVAGHYNNDTGALSPSTASVADERYFSVAPGTKYGILNDNQYRVIVAFYNANKVYEGKTGDWAVINSFEVPSSCKYARLCFNTLAGLNPSNYIPVDIYAQSNGIPEGGTEGQVLTPNGWSSNYPTNEDVTAIVEDFVTQTQLESELSGYASKSYVQQELDDYVQVGENVSNIANGAVTINSLSQAVKDAILAGGTESITNAPDDVDIENNSNNRLQLKGGGVVRFRVKDTPANNYNELVRCMAVGLPIQIEDVINLAHTDGSIRDITFGGETLVFVGNGQIKNCHIIGNVYIQANKTKIFDNVYFHHWTINGTSQVNGSSIYGMVLANTNCDVYNRSTKSLSAADTSVPVNPFLCSLTRSKIGSFITPVLQDGKYVYKEGDTVVLTFDDDGSGNIKLPIRKDYLFLDDGSVAESTYDIKTKTASYTYVAASDLTISRLFAPIRVVDGVVNGSVYPEWWGAKIDSSYDSNDAFQCAFLHGGNIQLSGDYFVSGNIRVYGNAKIAGNKHTIKLMDNTSASCMLEVETLVGVQDGITIYDLTLDGNKANNVGIQDGIFCDFAYGKALPFDGYSMDNTYWYNLMVLRFRGSGICCAVPGTSHIYSSYLAFNGQDGITWDNEHFTLTNVTCWGNDRHGAYAGGNHWRIIGGAYAHNGAGDNIYCEGAFESQIIGCSCIASGKFIAQTGGGYVASTSNPYGYIWAGEGQGTHALIGGNGINLNGCRAITIIGVRINNQNANGLLVHNGSEITVATCQFNQNNMTQGLFVDINSDITTLYISNTKYNGSYVVTNVSLTQLIFFGTNGHPADWSALQNYIPDFGVGVFNICDYWNASNRPSGSGSYLEGTIHVQYGLLNTVWRTYIRLMDQTGVQYIRYVNIKISDGTYSDDTGWKKIISTSV